MKSFVWRWIINAIALLVVAKLVQGIAVDNVLSLFMAALVLGVLNAVIRPILLLLTLPINILSLGLFTLVINALMLKIVDWLVIGFSTGSFLATMFAAIILSIISMILSAILIRS